MPVGAALGISGIAAAGANWLGGQTQAKATERASDVQRQQYQQTRSDLAPYRSAGVQGTNQLMGRLPQLTSAINPDQAWLMQTPGYRFALQQGLRGVHNAAAARGLGNSGAALRGAATFATGLADQTWQNQFTAELNQRNQQYNQLMGTAQLGAGAAGQTGQFGTQTAQNIGNNLTTGATAQAAGLTGATAALTGAAHGYMGYTMAQQQIAANAAANAAKAQGSGAPVAPVTNNYFGYTYPGV